MPKPQCFLMIGLPGAGKTTTAKKLEDTFTAKRFTPDEYILEHYGNELSELERDALRDPVEELLWAQAVDTISRGHNVVVDFGMWAVEERRSFRESAEQANAQVHFVVCEVDFDTAWQRVSQRPESQKGTLQMTKELLRECFETFQPLTAEEQPYILEPRSVESMTR